MATTKKSCVNRYDTPHVFTAIIKVIFDHLSNGFTSGELQSHVVGASVNRGTLYAYLNKWAHLGLIQCTDLKRFSILRDPAGIVTQGRYSNIWVVLEHDINKWPKPKRESSSFHHERDYTAPPLEHCTQDGATLRFHTYKYGVARSLSAEISDYETYLHAKKSLDAAWAVKKAQLKAGSEPVEIEVKSELMQQRSDFYQVQGDLPLFSE